MPDAHYPLTFWHCLWLSRCRESVNSLITMMGFFCFCFLLKNPQTHAKVLAEVQFWRWDEKEGVLNECASWYSHVLHDNYLLTVRRSTSKTQFIYTKAKCEWCVQPGLDQASICLSVSLLSFSHTLIESSPSKAHHKMIEKHTEVHTF